jgi:hypothetical protein
MQMVASRRRVAAARIQPSVHATQMGFLSMQAPARSPGAVFMPVKDKFAEKSARVAALGTRDGSSTRNLALRGILPEAPPDMG